MCLPCAGHKQSVKCVYAVPFWTNLTLHMKISSSRGTGSSVEAAELESGERRVWIQPFFAMLGVLSLSPSVTSPHPAWDQNHHFRSLSGSIGA